MTAPAPLPAPTRCSCWRNPERRSPVGAFIKVIASIFETFGAVGVCVALGGTIAVVAIHSAMKKDG